jgi:hypothetical protein
VAVGRGAHVFPRRRELRQDPSAISASRRVETPSRHRRDSCPSDEVVGGLFFDFEAIRTESMLRAGLCIRRLRFLCCVF